MNNHVEHVPLSELAEINPRKDVRINEESTPVSFIPMGDVSESGQWIQRQTRPLGEVDSGYTSFKEGDVLFAKITPCMENGKGVHARNLVNGIGFGSTEFHVLRAREGANARFIYHWTQTPMLRLKAESAMSGSAGQQRVKTWFFDEFEVPNLPLSEQRRIADVLDTVDAAIQETDAVVEKQEQVKTGLLQDLLTRGLGADGRLRDPEQEPEAFRETEELGRTPVDWEIVRLRDHITLPSGQIDPRQRPYRNWTLIAPNHIEEQTGRLIESETAAEQGAKSGKYVFREGDVIYSKIRPYLRKAYLADSKGICSADMYPLRPGERIRPRILKAIILGEHFSRFAEKVSMRSGIPKINRDELGEYKTALPPLDEQKRIEEVLVEHDQNVGEERSYREKLQRLKTGLMQDLLTGRVRVPEAEARVDEVVA